VKQLYVPKNFKPATLEIIEKVNGIVNHFWGLGFDLTLRQLFYQMVSRIWLANKQSEYKRLGEIVNDARYAGLIDWDRIVDRTRTRRTVPHWTGPQSLLDGCAYSYRIDKWKGQPGRPWVWIEKEALVGIIEPVCRRLDLGWFACKGYVSASEAHGAARDVSPGQKVLLLHLGDHDPSGLDMTRDIRKRFDIFRVDESRLKVKRIALNMSQVAELNPPPNPAKESDARFPAYRKLYGENCWELDALPPDYIEGIIEEAVLDVRDEAKWQATLAAERETRRFMRVCAENWPMIEEHVRDYLAVGAYREPGPDLLEDDDAGDDEDEEPYVEEDD
jgi:hypothetical protein